MVTPNRSFVAALFGAMLAIPVAANASQLPRILGVSFTRTGHSAYSAVLTGVHFGPTPGDIPCTSCTPIELQVVPLAGQPARVPVNVTAWSDSSVTVGNIPAGPGDALRIALYNAGVGNVAAWGGRVSRAAGVADIASITLTGTGRHLKITIDGSGFGPAPSQLGQITDSPYFVFTDFNAKMPGTDGFPWNAGFCGQNDCNAVNVRYSAWSDRHVVIGGFGGAYGRANPEWRVHKRDAFCIGIWPSTSTSNGTTGGTTRCKKVP